MPSQNLIKLLFLGHNWPEPNSSAAGYRSLALLDACLKQNWQVNFASAAEPTQYSHQLELLGVNCYSIEINNSNFELWIEQLQPDIVIFDRFMTEEQFSWRVAKICPECIRVIDTSDLHFLRHSRYNVLKTFKKKRQYTYDDMRLSRDNLNNDQSIREISAIYRSDLSLIISSYEYQLLQQEFDIRPDLLLYLGFMLESPEPASFRKFDDTNNFFMIGNYLHAPNWDAVQWCYQALWPKIRAQLPKAECHIYGAYTPEKAMQLHQPKQGFYIKGRAENLSSLLPNYRVNLAPLRFGAGIKGKIADGFCYGIPCVTTSIGAEGMADAMQWGGYIADDEDDFIDKATHLYKNCDIWQQSQKQACEIIKTKHNKEQNQSHFIKILNSILDIKKNNRLTERRNKNFMGSMLNYHLHRSHEFMSRWIEEKNR